MEVVRDTWKPLLESETPPTHSVAPAGKKSNSRTRTQNTISDCKLLGGAGHNSDFSTEKWIHENKELLFGSVTYKGKVS